MNHKLLVAVDGEKSSAKTAIYVGRSCAGSAGAENRVVLFHVLPALPPWIESGESANADSQRGKYLAEVTEAGERMLAEMMEFILREGVPASCVTAELCDEEGNIADLILDAARRHECDTIVVGRRGKSMVGQYFGGGVAERLLRHPIGFTIWLVE